MDEKLNIIRSSSTVVGTPIQDVSNFGIHGIGTTVYQNCFTFLNNILLVLNIYDLNLISKRKEVCHFRNELETSGCSTPSTSKKCPSPRIRNRFRKSWIEPQTTIRLILPIGKSMKSEILSMYLIVYYFYQNGNQLLD